MIVRRILDVLRSNAMKPPRNPMTPMQLDVIIVHGPIPINKSLTTMPRKPTARPNIGPPIIPPKMERKAAGLTLGGPPISTILVTATRLDKEINIAMVLVRLLCS